MRQREGKRESDREFRSEKEKQCQTTHQLQHYTDTHAHVHNQKRTSAATLHGCSDNFAQYFPYLTKRLHKNQSNGGEQQQQQQQQSWQNNHGNRTQTGHWNVGKTGFFLQTNSHNRQTDRLLSFSLFLFPVTVPSSYRRCQRTTSVCCPSLSFGFQVRHW